MHPTNMCITFLYTFYTKQCHFKYLKVDNKNISEYITSMHIYGFVKKIECIRK